MLVGIYTLRFAGTRMKPELGLGADIMFGFGLGSCNVKRCWKLSGILE
jgi:hypothetical protein